MSVIKQTKIWNGVTVEQRVNTDTGQMEIYLPAGVSTIVDLKLAETYQDGTSNKWRLTNKNEYKKFVNGSLKANGLEPLTDKTFDEAFFLDGAPTFNNDRAAVLNNNNNYATQAIARNKREGFFNNNIPLVVDPKTGAQVNSKGVQTSRQITGQQQVVENNGDDDGLNQVLKDGRLKDDTPDKRRLYANESGIARGGKTVTYRYPKQVPQGFDFDFIKITAHDYVASGLDVIASNRGGDDYFEADKNLGQPYETVIFPMQPQLSETNSVNWSDDQLNPLQAMFGNAAMNLITSGSEFDLKGIQGAFTNLFDNIKEGLKDGATKRAIAAYFAGQAVGANLQGRLTGEVINPNLELLFNGPNLRTFNFNFRLTPRTEEESQEIRKIIRCFKRNMAVQRTSSNIFLRSPRLFKLVYIYKDGGQHPYLNKFKPCAMSNFTVNYTPDGSYATFDKTGSLTAYDLNMSFSEIMPIYSSDFDKNDDNPTDMGF